jgi:hypothetical protein
MIVTPGYTPQAPSSSSPAPGTTRVRAAGRRGRGSRVAAAPSSTARSPILRGPSSTASVVQMRSAGVVTLRLVPYEIPSSTAVMAQCCTKTRDLASLGNPEYSLSAKLPHHQGGRHVKATSQRLRRETRTTRTVTPAGRSASIYESSESGSESDGPLAAVLYADRNLQPLARLKFYPRSLTTPPTSRCRNIIFLAAYCLRCNLPRHLHSYVSTLSH